MPVIYSSGQNVISEEETLFSRAKSLLQCTVCIGLGFLAGCQNQGGLVPEPEVSEQAMICDCKTSEFDEKPLLPAMLAPQVCPPVVQQVLVEPPLLTLVPKKKNKKAKKKISINDKLIIGRVEKVLVVSGQVLLKARIDTGAGLSSINGLDITNFGRDGHRWVRFALIHPKTKEKIYLERAVKRHVMIKQFGGKFQRRAVISMSLVLGTIEEKVDMTLTDRTGYVYQMLIGRNFLRDRAIVDVSDRFIAYTEVR